MNRYQNEIFLISNKAKWCVDWNHTLHDTCHWIWEYAMCLLYFVFTLNYTGAHRYICIHEMCEFCFRRISILPIEQISLLVPFQLTFCTNGCLLTCSVHTFRVMESVCCRCDSVTSMWHFTNVFNKTSYRRAMGCVWVVRDINPMYESIGYCYVVILPG